MSPAVRVLLVEDVHTDAELEVRELRRAGLRVDHRVVSTEGDFRSALENFLPEVIISDFSMPHFDGMAAVALARELAPDVPFIFVSGTIGEEYAIRALKSGATDYVLKSNLIRLPAAVERALEDARQRVVRQEAENMFREVLEHAPDPMIVVNASGAIVLANGQSEKVFGYRRDELVGRSVELLVPEGLRSTHAAHRDTFMNDARPRPMGAQLKLVAVHRDGHGIPVEISLAPLVSRREPMVVVSIRDQTERRAQEARIARLSRIRHLLGAVSSAIVRIREPQALFEEMCRISVAQGGFTLARVTIRDPHGQWRLAATTAPDDRIFVGMLDDFNRDPERAPSLLARALRTGQHIVSNDLGADERVPNRAALAADGTYSLALLPIQVDGRTAGLLALRAREPGVFDSEELRVLQEIVSNIAFALELVEKQTKLDYLAFYDEVSGLPNRTLFGDRLTQAIEVARRESQPLGLLVFNLERFNTINEALGKQAGDEALRIIAARLRGAIGDTSRVARLIGDAFAVMFPAIGGPADVVHEMTRAGEAVFGPPIVLDGREMKVAAKAGISMFPADGADGESLVRNAEAALAKAKLTGERYLFYTPQINSRVAEQVELEQRLRRAVDNGELILHYQPKVDLQSRRITGLEALMRWTDPDGKPVSPAHFVPVLEETGLIYEAGKQALARAALVHRAWKSAGLDAPRIAVNVSALQLRRGNFVEELVAALGDTKDCGVDLEVTESLMMEDVEATIAKLRQSRDLGLHIALDDFGTGYSSLAYLSRLPIDTLKIDRGFIRAISENANDVSLVTTMISLAQALRLKTVAEGVETEEQARLLRLLRCDQMQGYLFSPPLPVEKVEALLRRPPD